MKEQTGNFEGVNGVKLFYKVWAPEEPAKGVLAIIHGVGEHIDRYPHLVEGLVPAGFMLAGYDQRGHGRSEGQRGHIDSWAEYRGDIDLFLQMVRQMAPGRPLFILGHSMGSLEVLDYVLRYRDGLAGAIISGTALEPTDAAPPLLVLVAKMLSGIAPRFELKVKLEGSALSRDPEVARAYMEDPLVHWQRSARWGTEGLKTIEWIKAHAGDVQLPVLFVHGEKDPLLAAEGARRFYEQISYPDKTLRIYPDSRHECHNDLDCGRVVADVAEWMNGHLGEA